MQDPIEFNLDISDAVDEAFILFILLSSFFIFHSLSHFPFPT